MTDTFLGIKKLNCNDESETNDVASESALNDLLYAEACVVVYQFIAFMQMRSVNLCHIFIGDDPEPLTVDEMLTAISEFKETLK